MRVLLIGNYANNKQESMQRFAELMSRLLAQCGHEVRLVVPRARLGKLRAEEGGIGKWLGYIDRFVLWIPQLRRDVRWADFVHVCDHVNAVYLPLVSCKPYLVTCHDMLAIRSALGDIPSQRVSWTGRIYQRWILASLKRARRVVCVSLETQQDFLRVTGVPAERTEVVPNGLNYEFEPMKTDDAAPHLRNLGLDSIGGFLLHVGGNQWYKNRSGVLEIFEAIARTPGFERLELVMAGKQWSSELRSMVSQSQFKRRVREIVGASNEELQALYSTARALIFPSLYEGFGWPIIEAQACGCLVFTSDRAPMNMIGGNGAMYFNPGDICSARALIVPYVRDGDVSGKVSAALRNAGFTNARK